MFLARPLRGGRRWKLGGRRDSGPRFRSSVSPARPVPEGEERVFLNPVLRLPRGTREKQEGCLSLPGVYANVRRPEEVILHAFELSGDEFEQRIDGMFARVVQHEIDHLNGVLFIDHLDEESLDEVTPSLKQFTQEFSDAQREQRLPSDAHIAEMRAAWEQRYG